MVLTPKQHQSDAVEAVTSAFKTEDRAKLIMACGTGKTFTAYLIAQKLAPRVVGWFVPSLHLEKQFLEEVVAQDRARGIDATYIAIGSDGSVAAKEYDELSVDTSSLTGYVGTDEKVVTEALRAAKSQNQRVNFFLPYQSGPLFARCARAASITLDLGVFDEAHRTVGTKENLFSHLIHEESVSIRKRLFMTATPRVFARAVDDEAIDMDSDHYGRTVYELPFRAAIEQQLLVDYRIATHITTNAALERVLGTEVKLRDQAAAALCVLSAMKEHGIHRVITYHRLCDRARRFGQLLVELNQALPPDQQLPDFFVGHVTGENNVATRTCIIDDAMHHQFSVVTNARCLQEGVDEKRFDGVCFVDAKQSRIDIVQSVGRALRLPPPGTVKPFGWVIVPVFLEDGVDFHDLKEGAWQRLAEVVKHMAQADTAVGDEVRRVAACAESAPADAPTGFAGSTLFTGDVGLDGFTPQQLAQLHQDVITRIHESRVNTRWRLSTAEYHAMAERLSITWLGTRDGETYCNDTPPRNNITPTWWGCGQGHRWESTHATVTYSRGCPYCQNNRFTPAQEAEICRRYLKGESSRTIGKALGRAPTSVVNVLRRAKIPMRWRPMSDAVVEKICAAYSQGASASAVARQFNLDASTVRKMLKRLDVPTHKTAQAGLTPTQEEAAAARYQSGSSSYEVAKEFEVHPSTVMALLARKGVPARSRSAAWALRRARSAQAEAPLS